MATKHVVGAAVALVVGVMGVGSFVGSRTAMLNGSKLAAMKECAEARTLLNAVPTSPPKVIKPTGDTTNLVSVEVDGCTLSLPADAFAHDANPKLINAALSHVGYR